MKSKKYNGHRLQDARRLRGKTIAELSIDASMSKQTISQYELGNAEPVLEKAFLLANILHFPIDFFYEEEAEKTLTGTTFFRSFASTSKRERTAQVVRTEYIAMLFNVLKKHVEFPLLDIKSGDYDGVTPETAARKLREKWGIEGPILDMVRVLEKHGIFVSSLPTGSEEIDAFSQPSYQKGENEYTICVILGSEKESAVRRQFCAAHELGHLVLHNWAIDVEELKTAEFRNQEDEANCFAGAFLLPAEEFSSDVRRFSLRLDTFVQLKQKWHVSIGAQIIRAHNLGLVDDEEYTRLMKSYSARGWRREEPFDGVFGLEKPVLAQMAINLLFEKNVFSPRTLLDEFSNTGISLHPDFIEEVLSLEKGTLAISSESRETLLPNMSLKND